MYLPGLPPGPTAGHREVMGLMVDLDAHTWDDGADVLAGILLLDWAFGPAWPGRLRTPSSSTAVPAAAAATRSVAGLDAVVRGFPLPAVVLAHLPWPRSQAAPPDPLSLGATAALGACGLLFAAPGGDWFFQNTGLPSIGVHPKDAGAREPHGGDKHSGNCWLDATVLYRLLGQVVALYFVPEPEAARSPGPPVPYPT